MFLREVALGNHDDDIAEVSAKFKTFSFEARLFQKPLEDLLQPLVLEWTKIEPVVALTPPQPLQVPESALAGPRPADVPGLPPADGIQEDARRAKFVAATAEKELHAYVVGVLQADSPEVLKECITATSIWSRPLSDGAIITHWFESFAFTEDTARIVHNNPFFSQHSGGVPGISPEYAEVIKGTVKMLEVDDCARDATVQNKHICVGGHSALPTQEKLCNKIFSGLQYKEVVTVMILPEEKALEERKAYERKVDIKNCDLEEMAFQKLLLACREKIVLPTTAPRFLPDNAWPSFLVPVIAPAPLYQVHALLHVYPTRNLKS